MRRTALVVLTEQSGADGLPLYRTALRDDDPAVAAEAAYAISIFAPAELTPTQVRPWLASSVPSVREDAAVALARIGDRDVPLVPLLTDPSDLVRGAAVRLAAQRPLAADEIAALAQLSTTEDNGDIRHGAVTALAARAPGAEAVVSAALVRGDVDAATAQAILDRHAIGLVPAIAAHVAATHDAAFYRPLVELHAVCAAAAIATDDGAVALHALGELSAHPEWTEAQLRAWAAKQPPCAR